MAKLSETSISVLSSLKEAGKAVGIKDGGLDGRAVGSLHRKGFVVKDSEKGTAKITPEGRKALKENTEA